MTTVPVRSERINMRLSPDALVTLRRAAALQQQDLSGFVLGAALDHARDVVLKDQTLRLTPREADDLDSALDEDAAVLPALAALARAARADPRFSGTGGAANPGGD